MYSSVLDGSQGNRGKRDSNAGHSVDWQQLERQDIKRELCLLEQWGCSWLVFECKLLYFFLIGLTIINYISSNVLFSKNPAVNQETTKICMVNTGKRLVHA